MKTFLIVRVAVYQLRYLSSFQRTMFLSLNFWNSVYCL